MHDYIGSLEQEKDITYSLSAKGYAMRGDLQRFLVHVDKFAELKVDNVGVIVKVLTCLILAGSVFLTSDLIM